MTMHVKTPDGWKQILEQWYMDSAELKDIEGVWYKHAGTWKLVFTPIRTVAITISLSGTIMNFNLRNALLAAGWTGLGAVIATVDIAPGTVIGSATIGQYAFSTGTSYPSGSQVTINNQGSILGRGGRGGEGDQGDPSSDGYRVNGSVGLSGGPALFLGVTTIINNSGIIGGGGGGGGGGRSQPGGYYFAVCGGQGAGGGQGFSGGIGGLSWYHDLTGYVYPGTDGTISAPGTTYSPGNWDVSGQGDFMYGGGIGGTLGNPGAKGGLGTDASGYEGGPGGAAIIGVAFATINNTGSILGAQS